MLINSETERSINQDILPAHVAFSQAFGCDLNSLGLVNFIRLTKQLRDNPDLPESDRRRQSIERPNGELLSERQALLYKTWKTQIIQHFVLKHATRQLPNSLIAPAKRRDNGDVINHLTSYHHEAYNNFFVLGLGKQCTRAAHLCDSAYQEVRIDIGEMPLNEQQKFRGLWLSNHFHEFVKQTKTHPIWFGDTKREEVYQKLQLKKNTTYTRSDGTIIVREENFLASVLNVDQNFDQLFDGLFYRFLIELDYLGDPFRASVLNRANDAEWILKVFNEMFPNWQHTEAKLPLDFVIDEQLSYITVIDTNLAEQQQEFLKALLRYDIPSMQKLLDDGYDINITNSQDQTPLMVLVQSIEKTELDQSKILNCIDFLVDNGIRLYAKDVLSLGVLHFAVKHNMASLLQHLLKPKGPREGHSISHEYDINYYTKSYRPLLLHAIICQSEKMVKLLWAEYDAKMSTDIPWLTYVVEHLPGMTEAFIERGCQLNCNNSDGLTPLMIAAQKNHLEAAKLLLENGVAIDQALVTYDEKISNYEGCTALHFAASCAHEEMVTLLIQYKANIAAVDYNGLTPQQCLERALLNLENTSQPQSATLTGIYSFYTSQQSEKYASSDFAKKALETQYGVMQSQQNLKRSKYLAILNLLNENSPSTNETNAIQKSNPDSRLKAVVILVTSGEGETTNVLLCRKADSLGKGIGYWQAPGGLIETANPVNDAQRELLEETGLAIASHRLNLLHTFTTKTASKHYQLYFYHVHMTSSELTEQRLMALDDIGQSTWAPWSEIDLNEVGYWYQNIRIRHSNACLYAAILAHTQLSNTIDDTLIIELAYHNKIAEFISTADCEKLNQACQLGYDFSSSQAFAQACLVRGLDDSKLVELLDTLLACGAACNAQFRLSNMMLTTPVLLLCELGRFNVVKQLATKYQSKFNLNYQVDAKSVFSILAKQRAVDLMQECLQLGVKLIHQNAGSALLVGISCGYDDVIKFILDNSAINLNTAYPYGDQLVKYYTPIEMAVSAVNVHVVKQLCQQSVQFDKFALQNILKASTYDIYRMRKEHANLLLDAIHKIEKQLNLEVGSTVDELYLNKILSKEEDSENTLSFN